MADLEIGCAAAFAVPTLCGDQVQDAVAVGWDQADQLGAHGHWRRSSPLRSASSPARISDLHVLGVVDVVLAPTARALADARVVVDELNLVDPLGHFESDLGLHPQSQ